MSQLVLVLILGFVSFVSVVSLVVAVRSNKINLASITKKFLKQPQIVQLRSDLQEAVDGMNFYKKEAELWHNRYVDETARTSQAISNYYNERKEHQETFETLSGEINTMKKRMNNMEFIIGRMDGKRLVRDGSGNITEMKIVK